MGEPILQVSAGLGEAGILRDSLAGVYRGLGDCSCSTDR